MGTDIGILAEKMRWLGPMRYNIASLIKIFTYTPKQATLIIDEEEKNSKFSLLTVCNTIHIGKGMKMAPKAKLNDGLIDLIVVKSGASRKRLLQVLPKLFDGTHINEPEVSYFQTKKFSLQPIEDERLNIDGEIMGSTPIEVETIHNAIEFFCNNY